MCNVLTKINKQIEQSTPVYALQESEDEIFFGQAQHELSTIRSRLLEIFFDDCACDQDYFCDRCDFIERLENCVGLIDHELMGDALNYDNVSRRSHLDPREFVVQSGNTQAVTVNFGDNNEGEQEGFKAPITYTKPDKSWATDLDSYLKRPVLISTITWTVGGGVTTDLEPWHLYFNSTPIKKKLDNYFLMRCNLKMKFVINASPFYYGAVLVSYRPLTDSASSSFNPCPIYTGAGTGDILYMGRSQRPHAFIYPQTNEGCTLDLPFMYHMNWLDVTNASDLKSMGTVSLNSFGVLANANSVAGTTVNIQVYAWAEDIELAGATDDLAVQSGDEYGTGPVSSVASAVHRASSKLGDIPVIGPFMTATSYAAGAVRDIAKIFGFTNVPTIDNVHPMVPKPFPNMATTDIGTPMEKLTLDSKNELSIDPQICGCACDDPLVITNICSVESYLTTTTWTSAHAPNQLLFNTRVEPSLCYSATLASQTYVQGIPAWMVSTMFKYWRGDVIFRFKFLKSQYHRGRVKVTWDPVSSIQNTAETTTTCFTHIIDIADTDDIEFRVPYLQQTSYLECGTDITATKYNGTSAITSSPTTSNGVLTMRVLTDQSSPVSSADISILVFVKMADNIEFADPTEIPITMHAYAVQSGDEKVITTTEDMAIKPSYADDNVNLIYMGESIRSLRQLMRRGCYHRTQTAVNSAVANQFTIYQSSIFRRLPLYPGFDTDGINSATKPIAGGTGTFNFVHWVPMTWVTQCFVGVRGSVIWNALLEESVSATGRVYSHKMIRRNNVDLTVAGYGTVSNNLSTGSVSTWARVAQVANVPMTEGGCITTHSTAPTMNVMVPMYSKYKFLATTPSLRTIGSSTVDGSKRDAVQTTYDFQNVSVNQTRVDYYCSIGTDFNPIMFLNVPTLYYLATYPSAV